MRRDILIAALAIGLPSCTDATPTDDVSPAKADRARAQPLARVAVRGQLECRGCDYEELAHRIGAKPRKPLAKQSLSWPLAEDGYVDRQGQPAQYRLVIKFVDAVRMRADAGEIYSAARSSIADAVTIQRRHGLSFRHLITTPEADIDDLRMRALRRTLVEQPDMKGFLALDIAPTDRERMVRIGHEFQALDIVEFAEIEFLNPPPPTDIPPETPSFVDRQGYLGEDPGVNAKWAWEQGITGEGIAISDSEFGWWIDHEEFNEIDISIEPGHTLTGNQDAHGTAVLGVTSGQHNGYGVDGEAPDASPVVVYPEVSREGGSRRAEAVTNMVMDAEPGDCVMLEQQTRGPGGGFAPAELSMAVWTASKLGADAGVIVMSAAGNGSQDLDSGPYQEYRDRGSSGAIIVGAGDGDTQHGPKGFSTYGSRVDVQGWGGSVMSTGTYGQLFDGNGDPTRQSYGSGFNGTSSATPIATGAAALIQSYVKAKTGKTLPPKDLRDLMVMTGIEQKAGTDKHIGPLPDVKAAIESLDVCEENPPEVAISDPDGDVDSDETELKLTVVIDASDDTAVRDVQLEVDGEIVGEPDSEAPYEFEVELETGVYEIRAIATDVCENEKNSAPITVSVGQSDDDDDAEESESADGESSGDADDEESESESESGDDEEDDAAGDDEASDDEAKGDGGDEDDDPDEDDEGENGGAESSTGLPLDDAATGCACRSSGNASSSWALLGLGLLGFGWRRRTR